MNARKGRFHQTAMGREFWPLDPRADEVHFDDIAWALSMQVRFGGHVKGPYTVAQHSVLVSDVVEKLRGTLDEQRAGLLHDASEAYCVDVPRPIKPHLIGYKEIEIGIQKAIGERFGVDAGLFESKLIKIADNVVLATEKRDCRRGKPRQSEIDELPAPMVERITILDHDDALYEFAVRARELGIDVML